jgi:hypothetical protein
MSLFAGWAMCGELGSTEGAVIATGGLHICADQCVDRPSGHALPGCGRHSDGAVAAATSAVCSGPLVMRSERVVFLLGAAPPS